MVDKQLSAFGIALILTFMSSEHTMAKEPTVAETKAHIESIMNAGCTRYRESAKTNTVLNVVAGTPAYNIADTVFTFTDLAEGSSPLKADFSFTQVTRYQVALKDLDPKPEIIKVDLIKEGFSNSGVESYISFTCISGNCVRGFKSVKSGDYTNDSPIAQEKLVVPACGDEERFSRAFSHLVKLSGGKPALFK